MAKSNGFDFGGFRSSPVEREYFPVDGMKSGEGVTLQLNLDLLTTAKMTQLEDEYNAIYEDLARPFESLFKALKPAADEKPARKPVEEPENAADEDPAIEAADEKEEDSSLPAMRIFSFEKANLTFYARVLGGSPENTDPYDRLIHGWNVTENGKPMPVSNESFLRMPPHAVKRLYRFCLGAANNPTEDEKKVSADT